LLALWIVLGLALLIAIAAAIYYWYRHSEKSKREKAKLANYEAMEEGLNADDEVNKAINKGTTSSQDSY